MPGLSRTKSRSKKKVCSLSDTWGVVHLTALKNRERGWTLCSQEGEESDDDDDAVQEVQKVHKEDAFELADSCVTAVVELKRDFKRSTGKEIDDDEIKSVGRYVAKVKSIMEEYAEKIRAAEADDSKKFHDLTPFDVMIQSAGLRTAEFLRCFTLEFTPEEFPGLLSNRRFQYEGTHMKIARGPLSLGLPTDNPQSEDAKKVNEFFEQIAAKKPTASKWWGFEPVKLTEYDFRWIFLDSLVAALGPYENDTTNFHTEMEHLNRLRRMVLNLIEVDNDQRVFENVGAQALAYRLGKACRTQMILTAILAFVSLLCLIILTAIWNTHPADLVCVSNQEEVIDNGRCAFVSIVFFCLVLCNCIELFVIIVDMILNCGEWIDFWNALDFVLEVMSFVLILFLWTFDLSDITHPFTQDFGPWLLPIVNILRWIKVSFFLLRMQNIGEVALPIILAMFSGASIMMLFAIVGASFMAIHVYYGFRVLENDHTFAQYGLWGLFTVFFQISQVMFFEEGDPDELAGRKVWVSKDSEGGPLIIDNADEGPWGSVGRFDSYYETLNVFAFGGLAIGVVLMNAYIGVLSQKYSEYSAYRVHYYTQWRAQWMVQALRRRIRWAKNPCFGFLTKRIAVTEALPAWTYDKTEVENINGFWDKGYIADHNSLVWYEDDKDSTYRMNLTSSISFTVYEHPDDDGRPATWNVLLIEENVSSPQLRWTCPGSKDRWWNKVNGLWVVHAPPKYDELEGINETFEDVREELGQIKKRVAEMVVGA